MFILQSGEEITIPLICQYLQIHRTKNVPRYDKLKRYYENEHDILRRVKLRESDPNNRIVNNYAKYITDINAGYLVGSPAVYKSYSGKDITELSELMRNSKTAEEDDLLAENQSIYGIAYEYDYIETKEDGSRVLGFASIEPQNCFIVYSDTVKLQPVCGVYYYELIDKHNQNTIGYDVTVSTTQKIMRFRVTTGFSLIPGFNEEEVNLLGKINIISFWNNKRLIGDFESVITLIDGYNQGLSDALNDEEKFMDSLMVLKGQTLGDTDDEKEESMSSIRQNRVIEISEDSELDYLTSQLNGDNTRMLLDTINNNIHKFSYIPDMSDEKFAGNISGEAMKYKLFGLKLALKKKANGFKTGLTERLEIINAFRRLNFDEPFDLSDIKIELNPDIPRNDTELVNMIVQLSDLVSHKTLLAQLPFIDDVDAEIKQAEEEKQVRMNQELQFIQAQRVGENDDNNIEQ